MAMGGKSKGSEDKIDVDKFIKHMNYIIPTFKNFIEKNKNHKDPSHKLRVTTNFVNAYINYESDKSVFSKEDKWQGPYEFFLRGKGDCEDYAIAKYFIMRALGVPKEELSIAYVKSEKINEPHMVTLYHGKSKDFDKSYILDNMTDDLTTIEKNKYNYKVLYTFNEANLFTQRKERRVGSSTRLTMFEQMFKNQKNFEDIMLQLKPILANTTNEGIDKLLKVNTDCYLDFIY